MPAAVINKDAREGKGSKKSLEKKWKEAKDIVKDQYGTNEDKWGVVQTIYQNKRDAKASVNQGVRQVKLNAAARLKATMDQEYTDIEGDEEVSADAFEGFTNTLPADGYHRPEGADYVILNAPLATIQNHLKKQEWTSKGNTWSKGEHAVELTDAGEGKTQMKSIK